MRKYLVLFVLLIASVASLHAQDVSFAISAPESVVEGAQFQLRYILKGGSGNEKIDFPEEIDGFEILYGPSVSSSFSQSYINGKSSSESSVTFTYLLQAKKEGRYAMPKAKIKVNGRNYESDTARLRVLPPDKDADPTEQGRQPQAIHSRSKGDKVDPQDAFVRAIFSRSKVHEQEAVVATFRFYTVLNISNVSNIEFPEFEGFMTEEFDLPVNRQWTMEHYNGKNYMVLDVKKTLLFPQRSGKMTIPAGKMDMTFEIASGRVINHPLFGPQDIMTETKKTLKTSPVTINVESLPKGKPLDFSGAVGSFTVKSSLSNRQIKANDAITLKIDIQGEGNMKLIKNPEVELDKNIEAYDPKVTNAFVIGNNGLTGKKTVEYLLIPRYAGKYMIPAVEFSFFDTKSRSYKTVKTDEYEIEVAPDPKAGQTGGATSYMSQQEVKVEQDIRYLKIDEFEFKNPRNFSLADWTYILWYVIPFILLVVIIIIYREQVKANADIARMRTKKANKVASRRLRVANKHLKDKNKDGFYEEVLKAVWGYLSDKLTIPGSDLTRENVEIELLKFGADEKLIKEYIEIIDTCEFARYAPSESSEAMDNLYNETVDAIGNMEKIIKIK